MRWREAKKSWSFLLEQIPDASLDKHDRFHATVAFVNGYEFEFRLKRDSSKSFSPWYLEIAHLLKEPEEIKTLVQAWQKAHVAGDVPSYAPTSGMSFLTAAGFKFEQWLMNRKSESDNYITTRIYTPLTLFDIDNYLQLAVLLGNAYFSHSAYQMNRGLGHIPPKPKGDKPTLWHFSDWHAFFTDYWFKNVHSKKKK